MRSFPLHSVVRSAIVLMTLTLCACASAEKPATDDDAYAINDPLESVNRTIFSVDLALDDYVIKPTAVAYRDYIPEPVRNSIHNFLTNLRSPVILFNDGLQGQGKLAGDTFARMWLNTILGLGGIFDVGTKAGIPFHDADFGQTFGVWGVPAGPYLVLPVLGPSNPRDAVGLAADTLGDPMNGYLRSQGDAGTYAEYGRGIVAGIDLRSRNIDILDRIRSTSLDYYAAIRSLYNQRRASQIRHEAPPDANPALSRLPDMGAASTPQLK
jgi:phospholipid-binding lipoprotein MlaA